MQIHHFFAGLTAAVFVAGSVATVSAEPYHPENRGTYEQQMACTGDVFRLCGREIPDEGRITNCLRNNVPSLSRGCRAVFEPTGSISPSPGQRPDRRDAYPRDRDAPRDRDGFDNFDQRRPPPSYDNRRDRDDDD